MPSEHGVESARRHIGSAEAWRLLGTVSVGRILFTRDALPTARPVNHVLDGGDIVICTQEAAGMVPLDRADSASDVVVAYETDSFDADFHLQWTVVITGYARLVTTSAELAHIRALFEPWAPMTSGHYAVRIHPELIAATRSEPRR